jgi:hypothetical protein
MKQPMAFRACYSDWKLIKTRSVVQVVMEVPLADADAAYNVLGGMPNSAHENWFAVAPLKLPLEAKENPKPPVSIPATPRSEQDKPLIEARRRPWEDFQPQQQAGMRCNDPVFIAFLKEVYTKHWREIEDAAAVVRSICGVHSRVELGTNQKARVMWHSLDEQYLAWKALEHA